MSARPSFGESSIEAAWGTFDARIRSCDSEEQGKILMTDNTKLLELAFRLWLEAADSHSAGKSSACGACWKSYMAAELWRNTTDMEIPVNFQQAHEAAQFKLRTLRAAIARRAA